MTTEHKIIIGTVIATIVIIFGSAFLSDKSQKADLDRLSQEPLGERIQDQGGQHVARGVTEPEYNSNPPTSGRHWANATAGPGIKSEPIADELLVHSMEHGAVVLWYRADLSEGEVETIKEAFRSASGKKIMLPRTELDVPVALTSWNYLLKLENIDTEIIKAFIETNNDRAPEKAPI